MSSSRGNVSRTRTQKYQNRSAFKNDLHDKTNKIKFLNSLQIHGVCGRCKEIIDWKIKYKKYKPLTAPKKCVRCELKTVKHAYHVMCLPCGKKENVCSKCCKKEEIIEPPAEDSTHSAELQQVLKSLPERKRRTLLRYLKKQSSSKSAKTNVDDDTTDDDENLQNLIAKLKLDNDDADYELSNGSDSEREFDERSD